MTRMIVAGLLLVLMAPVGMAEGTKEDWARLAQPTVDVFGQCTRDEVDRRWKTSTAAADVARAATKTCEEHLDPLKSILAAKPFSAGEAEIEDTLQLLKDEMVEAARADIEKRRKE